MSTPRKRTKAEAERVRQVNLLARLWRSRMLANGLLAGQSTVPPDGFAIWLRQYTGTYLLETLKRCGSNQINRTKLAGYITYLGANRRRQGESPVLMTEAVIETRRVVVARRTGKEKRDPFPKEATEVLQARYQRVANRILARAFQPIAGWDRLAWVFEESIWKSRTNWTKTLDELAAEQAKTLDKQLWRPRIQLKFSDFSESKLLTATEVRSKIQDSGGGARGESVRPKVYRKRYEGVPL